MYFENYAAEPIVPKAVEGRFLTKVNDVQSGTTKDNVRYTRVDLIIDAPAYPHVSLFLTDGPSFNSHFTAFCDTFDIPRGNQNFESWKGKKGWLDISIVQKDGFKNMRTSYILDENGWVMKPQSSNQQQPIQQQQQPHTSTQYSTSSIPNDEDIPF